MSRNGRPLRFLAVTLGGWTAVRAFMLWPAAVIPASAAVPTASAVAGAVDPVRGMVEPVERPAIAPWPGARVVAAPGMRLAGPGPKRPAIARDASIGLPPPGDTAAVLPQASEGTIPAPLRPTPIARGRSRLAGSAWGIARGGGNGTLLGGQLGASQAGARLTYALGEGRRVALSARIATPLRGRGKEAALGLDWQPTRMPLHLIAEQRVSLDGARGGPTLMVVGGINPVPTVAGFRLEGYGQAGAIKRDVVEAFGDGAARLTRVVASVGPARIDLGGGTWGAAQRGARRLDIGPTIGAVVPVARQALRLTLDWRERIAGDARPGSGPALSIGTDF